MKRQRAVGNVKITSAAQALRASKSLPSIWSNESRLSQRILIYIAELMERQLKATRRRRG